MKHAGWIGLALLACADPAKTPPQAAAAIADVAADVPKTPADYDKAGPYRVASAQLTAVDAARGRTVHMTLWAPVDASVKSAPTLVKIDDFYPPGPERDTLHALLATAPTCTSAKVEEWGEVAVAPGPLPLVAFSHCSACFRTSSFSLAERLASHGIAVVAADHTGNTWFDKAGDFTGLTAKMLETRVADVRFALDTVLDQNSQALPASWRGRFDAKRVGVFGHSFGGVTAGRVLQDDPRVLAGLAIAVPMRSPGLPTATVTNLHKPVLWILAKEDHSIMEFGNDMIRQDFKDALAPAWLLEVADAGHFTFSDIAGLTASFTPGCGTDTRQIDDKPFTYLDPAAGRAIAARTVAAFFGRFLLGDTAAEAVLDTAAPAATVTVQTKK